MTHEPECIEEFNCLDCGTQPACTCKEVRAAYRRGYNDHARSRAFGAEVYGVQANQHGQGENP